MPNEKEGEKNFFSWRQKNGTKIQWKVKVSKTSSARGGKNKESDQGNADGPLLRDIQRGYSWHERRRRTGDDSGVKKSFRELSCSSNFRSNLEPEGRF